MAKPRAIILGWINEGNIAQCGETVKNQHIISQLNKFGIEVITLDFFHWKRRPWVVAKTLLSLLLYPRTPLILSSGPRNVNLFMKMHSILRSKRKVIQWVIGGNLHKLTEEGIISKDHLKNIEISIVESKEMERSLKDLGVDNVLYMPNFKPISYLPDVPQLSDKIKFIFLSRIIPEKGVEYIFHAIRQLNEQGLTEKFCVDFYGNIDEAYERAFKSSIEALPNAEYRGFLNLSEKRSYNHLSTYSAMLFPTYWKSEGFAGIFIDAFIAGLPVIASDWAHNALIIDDKHTGIIIPPHNTEALANAMKDFILGKVDIEKMKRNCQHQAMRYDIDSVVNKETLKQIGLL